MHLEFPPHSLFPVSTPAYNVEPFLLLNNSDGCFRVTLSQIIYCSSYNSSTVFHLTEKQTLVIAKPITYYENLLTVYGFVRIHASALIHVAYLCHLCKGDDANELMLTTHETLSVARERKNEVMNRLRQLSIEPVVQASGLQKKGKTKQVKGKKRQKSQKTKPTYKE